MKKGSCLFKTRRRYFARGHAHCGGGEGGVDEGKLCVEGGEADKGYVRFPIADWRFLITDGFHFAWRCMMTLESLLRPIGRLRTRELSPMQAWSQSQVDALVSTWSEANEYGISIDGVSVSLSHRRKGEESAQQIQISRSEFNRMIQWYTRPQKLRTVKQMMASVLRIGNEINGG
jgi:hypothetical protein